MKTRTVVLSLLLAAGVFLALASDTKEKDKEKEVKKAAVTAKITAPNLLKEYKDNEVRADGKYKGKVLEVSGTVDGIGKDLMDTMYVSLKGDVIFGIQCMFAKKHESKLASLKKGQEITLKGKCTGKMGNVILRGCMLVE